MLQSHSLPASPTWLMDQVWRLDHSEDKPWDIRFLRQTTFTKFVTMMKNLKLGHSAHYILETAMRSVLNSAKFLDANVLPSVHCAIIQVYSHFSSIWHSLISLIFQLFFQWSQCIYVEATSPQASISLGN